MQEEKSFLNEIDWSMSLIDRFFCATLVAETQQILARARLVRRSINDWRASAEFLQVCLAERSVFLGGQTLERAAYHVLGPRPCREQP